MEIECKSSWIGHCGTLRESACNWWNSYPWDCDISDISDVIEAYIECPENELMQPFTDDKWGITDILRACDRRIGKQRLIQMHDETENAVVREIIEKRLR